MVDWVDVFARELYGVYKFDSCVYKYSLTGINFPAKHGFAWLSLTMEVGFAVSSNFIILSTIAQI